jgi:hypothetical protein
MLARTTSVLLIDSVAKRERGAVRACRGSDGPYLIAWVIVLINQS